MDQLKSPPQKKPAVKHASDRARECAGAPKILQ